VAAIVVSKAELRLAVYFDYFSESVEIYV